MSDTPFFDRSPAELSDAELRVALYVVCEKRDAVAESDPEGADIWNGIARTLADERDSRRALQRAVDEAIGGPVLMTFGQPDDTPPAA